MQQQEILQVGNAVLAGHLLAEAEESAQLITEIGKSLVLFFAESCVHRVAMIIPMIDFLQYISYCDIVILLCICVDRARTL